MRVNADSRGRLGANARVLLLSAIRHVELTWSHSALATRSDAMSTVLDLALILTGLSYVSLAPFTKVEESFNLHATHDVLMYGVSREALKNVCTSIFGAGLNFWS